MLSWDAAPVLRILSLGLLTTACILALSRYRKLPPHWKIIAVLLSVSLLCEGCGKWLKSHGSANNVFLYNIYIGIDAALIALCALLMSRTAWLRGLCAAAVMLVLGTWLEQYCHSSIDSFFHRAFLCECFLLPLLYLMVLFQNAIRPAISETQRGDALLCVCIVFYYSCNVPMFGLMNYFLAKARGDLADRLYGINLLLSVLRYSLILAGILLIRRSEKRPRYEFGPA